MPAETIRDAVIDLLWARSIPYTEKRESGTIETAPVVPSRVEGWRQKMSEGDCETVFRVRIDPISQGKSQLSIQVLFPPSDLNQAKSCEKSVGLLRDRFLDEVHNALMTGQSSLGLGGRIEDKQVKSIMAVAVRAANLRSGPTTRSKVVTRLGYGSKVAVLGRQGEWVRVDPGSGGEAWIHGSLLEDVASEDAGGQEEPGPETAEREKIRPMGDSTKPEPKNDEQTALSPPADTPASREEDATGPPREGEMQEKKIADLEDTEKGEAAGDPEADATADPAEKQTAQGVDSPQKTPQTETSSAPTSAPPLLVIRDGPAVHVFRDPNVFSPKIGKIQGGTRIASFEKSGNFFKVSHGGLEGYVYKDFCKIQE